MAAIILKGNIKIAPVILKTRPKVKPIILNGNKISQKKTKRNNTPIANGQHIENNMQKSIKVINNFIHA
jgi:hypothetical protein